MVGAWLRFLQKTPTVYKTLYKLSLEGDHTPKCLWSVKAYNNFGVERDTLNLETARKTKRMDEVIIINILTNYSNVQRQDTVFAYQR